MQRDRETERQEDRETGRQRDRETGRQRDRETGRQRDRETGRQGDRETERQEDRETETQSVCVRVRGGREGGRERVWTGQTERTYKQHKELDSLTRTLLEASTHFQWRQVEVIDVVPLVTASGLSRK